MQQYASAHYKSLIEILAMGSHNVLPVLFKLVYSLHQ